MVPEKSCRQFQLLWRGNIDRLPHPYFGFFPARDLALPKLGKNNSIHAGRAKSGGIARSELGVGFLMVDTRQ